MKTVFVTIYSHKYGDEVNVFPTMDRALQHMNEIADELWEEMFHDPKPVENIGKEYFHKMAETSGSESFTIHSALQE